MPSQAIETPMAYEEDIMLIISLLMYSLICLFFFLKFRELYPQMDLPFTMFVSTIWPVSMPFGYVMGVIRIYKENNNKQ